MRIDGRLDNGIKQWWYLISDLFSFHIEISLFNAIILMHTFLINFTFQTNFPSLYKFFWKNIFCKCIQLTTYKSFEIQLTFENTLRTGLSIGKCIHCDHASFDLMIKILGFTFSMCIYDHRHWDHENDKFEIIDDV